MCFKHMFALYCQIVVCPGSEHSGKGHAVLLCCAAFRQGSTELRPKHCFSNHFSPLFRLGLLDFKCRCSPPSPPVSLLLPLSSSAQLLSSAPVSSAQLLPHTAHTEFGDFPSLATHRHSTISRFGDRGSL